MEGWSGSEGVKGLSYPPNCNIFRVQCLLFTPTDTRRSERSVE